MINHTVEMTTILIVFKQCVAAEEPNLFEKGLNTSLISPKYIIAERISTRL